MREKLARQQPWDQNRGAEDPTSLVLRKKQPPFSLALSSSFRVLPLRWVHPFLQEAPVLLCPSLPSLWATEKPKHTLQRGRATLLWAAAVFGAWPQLLRAQWVLSCRTLGNVLPATGPGPLSGLLPVFLFSLSWFQAPAPEQDMVSLICPLLRWLSECSPLLFLELLPGPSPSSCLLLRTCLARPPSL